MDGGFAQFALLCALAALLVSAAIEDLRIREIANWKNAAILALAPAFWWASGLDGQAAAVQALVAAIVFAVFVGIWQLGQMGGGDVKMLGALALWFPWQPLIGLLMVMAVAGGVLTLALLMRRRIRRDRAVPEIPYGVAIAFAGLISIHQPILNHFA